MGGGGTVHSADGTVEASLLLISLCGTQIIRRIKYSDGLQQFAAVSHRRQTCRQ